jgi:hypothetical protein
MLDLSPLNIASPNLPARLRRRCTTLNAETPQHSAYEKPRWRYRSHPGSSSPSISGLPDSSTTNMCAPLARADGTFLAHTQSSPLAFQVDPCIWIGRCVQTWVGLQADLTLGQSEACISRAPNCRPLQAPTHDLLDRVLTSLHRRRNVKQFPRLDVARLNWFAASLSTDRSDLEDGMIAKPSCRKPMFGYKDSTLIVLVRLIPFPMFERMM